MREIKKLFVLAVVLAIISAAYVYLLPHDIPRARETWQQGLGEFVGSAVLWLFAIIYGRTLLKIALRQGPLLERILPESPRLEVFAWARTVLRFLNKTHPYVGLSAVFLIFGHGILAGAQRWNLLLEVVAGLALWQCGFGLYLLFHYEPVFLKRLKRYSYAAHAQLYTGIALGVFAFFGHLLVGN